jgi:hypothetical protein
VDVVVFDHGVGEQAVAHGFDRLFGPGRVGLGEFELDVFALADVLDA